MILHKCTSSGSVGNYPVEVGKKCQRWGRGRRSAPRHSHIYFNSSLLYHIKAHDTVRLQTATWLRACFPWKSPCLIQCWREFVWNLSGFSENILVSCRLCRKRWLVWNLRSEPAYLPMHEEADGEGDVEPPLWLKLSRFHGWRRPGGGGAPTGKRKSSEGGGTVGDGDSLQPVTWTHNHQ